MSRSTISAATFAAMAFMCCFGARAAAPTQDEMQAALVAAQEAWGAPVPVMVSSEPLNSCHAGEIIAITRVEVSTTTLTIGDVAQKSVSYKYAIVMNSACTWTPRYLEQAMIHEYGHVLIGADYHSRDKHSIMYWQVESMGKIQRITPEDRAAWELRISARM